MKLTLGKDKKLKSKKAIEQLFTQGSSVRKGALKCVFLPDTSLDGHKIGFSVSKRFFKKAPDRNRIKRLMRETYRLQQEDLVEQKSTYLNIMFIYQSNRLPDYDHIQPLMKKLIKELAKVAGEKSDNLED
jgi:ribonuclease P protein component